MKIVTLVPMTEDEFQAYLRWAIPDYAQDNVRSGSWTETEALRRSEEQFRDLLPEGLHTADQYLLAIHDPGLKANVGMLWFSLVRDRPGKPAFLFQLRSRSHFAAKATAWRRCPCSRKKSSCWAAVRSDYTSLGTTRPRERCTRRRATR
jgi:hypothetical protein